MVAGGPGWPCNVGAPAQPHLPSSVLQWLEDGDSVRRRRLQWPECRQEVWGDYEVDQLPGLGRVT